MLKALLEAGVRAKAPASRHQGIGKPAAELRLRISSLDPQRLPGLLPQRRGPVPQAGATQHLALESLTALAQFRGRLEAVGEPGDPLLELMPRLVVGIVGQIG